MKNRKVFILLWGPSGCGKDYFVKNLSLPACKGDIQFTKPVLFTDRPMRANERQKEPYIFCTNNSDNFSQDMPLFDNYMDNTSFAVEKGSLVCYRPFYITPINDDYKNFTTKDFRFVVVK